MILVKKHFKRQLSSMQYSYQKLNTSSIAEILRQCKKVVQSGNSIIVTGLGKNVPVCEKFVGTLTSVGIRSHFMHTNSAVHGDLGLIHQGDLVIVLSKSGETSETLYLAQLLQRTDTKNWLITCHKNTSVEQVLIQSIVLPIVNEGDPWDLIPNNSSLVFLMFLQSLAMSIIEELSIKLDLLKKNHPGGDIGKKLIKNTNSSNLLYINKVNQLENNLTITSLASRIRVLSFDLDGTLVGKSIPKIPLHTFNKISANYTTILATGAGLDSVKRKINSHYSNKTANQLIRFSGPLITNEGGQIYQSLSPRSLLHQSKLSVKAISFISGLVSSNKLNASFYGFYSPSKGSNSSGSKYNILLIDRTAKKPLVKKYGSANFTFNLEKFIKLMARQGVVKFIAKLEKRPRNSLKNKHLNIIYNEGYLNFISHKSSKITGLENIQKILKLKVTSNNLIHFGNDTNDYPLLKFCRLGVVVNSDPVATRLLIPKLKKLTNNYYIVISPKLLPLLLSKLAGN